MVILVKKKNTCLLSVYLGSDRWVMSVAEMTWGGCFDLFFLQHDHQWLLIVMVVLIFINPMVVRMVRSADLKKPRPDSKSALIFCAIRTDSGDWGLNLKKFQENIKSSTRRLTWAVACYDLTAGALSSKSLTFLWPDFPDCRLRSEWHDTRDSGGIEYNFSRSERDSWTKQGSSDGYLDS